MGLHRANRLIPALVLVFTASLLDLVHADTNSSAGVPLPSIAKAQGEDCVAETGFMRRNHMDLLKHQRDETMLRGVRDEPFSLKECLDCHVVKGSDALPVTASDPQHFCRSCHDYAAVSIDCFQCHASRPGNVTGSGASR